MYPINLLKKLQHTLIIYNWFLNKKDKFLQKSNIGVKNI